MDVKTFMNSNPDEKAVFKLTQAQQTEVIKAFGKPVPHYEKDRVKLILDLHKEYYQPVNPAPIITLKPDETLLKAGIKGKRTEITKVEIKLDKFELIGEKNGKQGFSFKNQGTYNGSGKIILVEGANVKVKKI